MKILLDERSDGCSLYIDGYLQFDSSDEAIYHESLVLPALCLVPHPKRVLIVGGGDGLAARECLRFPGVEHVDLVDFSSEVLDLGRQKFRSLNDGALEDPRLRIHLADAWTFEAIPECYDAIFCDLTFPTSEEDARFFSVEWYRRLASALAASGIFAVNSVSPELTPKAYAVVINTIRAAGLCALPYRVCIPSFRAHGYGAWGFVLGAKRHITLAELADLQCPVPTRQADMDKIARGAHFSRSERNGFRAAEISTLASPAILSALHSGMSATHQPLPDLEDLLASIPEGHTSHTREMIQTLAESVVGCVRTLDLRKLVNELWARAESLPARLRQELSKLRDFLQGTIFRAELWENWSAQLFAVLVIVMTVANSIAPDHAYGKGGEGLGHASISRGYSGMHAEPSFHSTSMQAETRAVTGRGFRTPLGNEPVDIYGYRYRSVQFNYSPYYYDNGYYGGGGGYQGGSGLGNAGAQRRNSGPQQPVFVADDDMLVMKNGDVVVTLSDDAYLLATGNHLALMSHKSPKPVAQLYADPPFLKTVHDQIQGQRATVALEIDARQNWLSWVGWTSSMFSTVRDDKSELAHLKDLASLLVTADKRVGEPSGARQISDPTGQVVELFVGCYLLSDCSVQIYGPDGTGKVYLPEDLKSKPTLAGILRSVAKKLLKETQADLNQAQHDLRDTLASIQSIQQDLTEYQNIQMQNYGDPDYEVDYGTDSVPVSRAITLTQSDLSDAQNDEIQLRHALSAHTEELSRFSSFLSRMGYLDAARNGFSS